MLAENEKSSITDVGSPNILIKVIDANTKLGLSCGIFHAVRKKLFCIKITNIFVTFNVQK